MTDREVFVENLNYYLKTHDKMQKDLAEYVGAKTTTVSGWTRGVSYPRADAMGKLCKFFGVKQSVLTEEHSYEKTNEEYLLDIFRSLSDKGQGIMLERAEELRKLYPKRGNKDEKE